MNYIPDSGSEDGYDDADLEINFIDGGGGDSDDEESDGPDSTDSDDLEIEMEIYAQENRSDLSNCIYDY